MLLLLAACAAHDLATSGFDGLAAGAEGFWVRERLTWTDGSAPDEVLHHLILGRDIDPCANWMIEAPPAPEPTGDSVADCEATRSWFGSQSGAYGGADQLRFEMELWDTTRDDHHIGVEPREGTFTGLDGPDEDEVEFALFAERRLFDWYAAVAGSLDCAAADPWAGVPAEEEAYTLFDRVSGALRLEDPRGDRVRFELMDLVVVRRDGAESPGGVLDGAGVFVACDVAREITPEVTID